MCVFADTVNKTVDVIYFDVLYIYLCANDGSGGGGSNDDGGALCGYKDMAMVLIDRINRSRCVCVCECVYMF